jgi:pilus assembly protein FimV
VTSGRIGTQVSDGAGAAPRDTVRLSRGEGGKGKDKGGAGDRVRELEEEIVAREKALAEANARIAQLEQIIKDSQRAVELKSPGMAAAQKGAEKSAQVAAAPEASAPAKAPDPAAGTPDQPPADAADKGAPPTVTAETPAATEPPPAAQPETPAVAKAPAPPAPEPAPETDFVTTVLEEPLYLAAGGIALLGGLGLLVAARRRRSAGADAGLVKVAPSLGGGGAAAATSVSAAAPDSAPAARRGGAPARPGGRSGGGDDNDLDFNVGMRRGASPPADVPPAPQIAPAAAPAEPAPRATQPAPRMPEPPPRVPEPPSLPEAPTIMPEPPRASEPMRAPEPARAPEPPRAQDHAARATETLRAAQEKARAPEREPLEPLMPDFALDSPSSTPPPAPASAPSPAARDPNLLDFDLDPLPPVSRPADMEKVSSEPPASMDFKLDLDDLDVNAPAPSASAKPARDDHWYDVQQKFDLAKAYEEMGDKSGARDILQEVLREGDAEQQSQAKKLLGTLS